MNSKKAKLLRRNARIIGIGKPHEEVIKIIKRTKIVYKSLTVNDKTR
jgi:hypothetical protein